MIVSFSNLKTKIKDFEEDMQAMKTRHECDETKNQILYSRNVVHYFQNERAKLVLLMNFTRICRSSISLDKLNASITTRLYNSIISQDLSNRVPKYKALLQEKKN